MDADALKRSFSPVVIPYFEVKQCNSTHRSQLIESFLMMISKFSQQENDTLAEKIIHLRLIRTPRVLTVLKQLRKQNVYVNEALFKAVNEAVIEENRLRLEKKDYQHLDVPHMTAEQVNLFLKIDLEKESKKSVDGKRMICFKLQQLASLPADIYPADLRKIAFDFLSKHLNDESWIQEGCLRAFIVYIKTNDFSDPASHKILIERCEFAFTGIRSNREYDDLLKACVDQMTDQEVSDHVVPFIFVAMQKNDVQAIQSISETLKVVFARVNDQRFLIEFFEKFLALYLKQPMYDEEILLSILVNKLNPINQINTCRKLLKSNALPSNMDEISGDMALMSKKIAYVLVLFYKKNQESYPDLPVFCNGDQYKPDKSDEPENKRKCAVM